MKKGTLQLLFLSLFSMAVYSQNQTVNIDAHYFNRDLKKKIIVVNMDVGKLNSLYADSRKYIRSEEVTYTLINPVSEFKTGSAYKVIDAQNNSFDLYFTQLPIVNITTNHIIVDEPRVYAHFSICENDGNYIENAIGVEYRGGWTQTLPKKSLRIEFWNDTLGNDTKNISLLHMRKDDDWNIQAMYNEPLRLRSKIGFELWNKMDSLYYAEDEPEAINGVNQEYVELFVNKEYNGLYALSERVDRKQLKLKKFKNEEMRGELYKGISWGASTFTSLPPYNNDSLLWSGFEYEYPDEETDWNKLYEFVHFAMYEDSISFYQNYQDWFNLDNAVDYFIFLNVLRATDNAGKNIFIARYNTDEPYFYIPWDLDGSFGMIWDGTKENVTTDILTNGFYKRLIRDNRENGFLEKLKNKWHELRSNVIVLDSIIKTFNTQFDYLKSNGVYQRELKAWPNCEFFDYNNIEYTSGWLQKRLDYLDNAFNNPELLTNMDELKRNEKTELLIYPNPASHFIYFKDINNHNHLKRLSVVNSSGQPLKVYYTNKNNGRIDIQNLNSGVYLIIADFKNGFREVEKLIIKKE